VSTINLKKDISHIRSHNIRWLNLVIRLIIMVSNNQTMVLIQHKEQICKKLLTMELVESGLASMRILRWEEMFNSQKYMRSQDNLSKVNKASNLITFSKEYIIHKASRLSLIRHNNSQVILNTKLCTRTILPAINSLEFLNIINPLRTSLLIRKRCSRFTKVKP
jgi:hypothetical protein